jgi:hypothetical protein
MFDTPPLIIPDTAISAVKQPGPFQVPPLKWRRTERPESQLTAAAATALIAGGRLKPRDLTTLRAVWMYGVMTTTQIIRLLFDNLTERSANTVASRRLNFLYQEHCLNRAWQGLGQDFVYTLDVQGARLLQMEQQELNWSAQAAGEKLLRLDHSLGITGFGVNLTHAARTWDGGGELRWYGDHVLTLTTKAGTRFKPDALGLLRLAQARTAFFLEWDRDRETGPVVANKVKTCVDYLRSDEWHSQFRRFPAVLIVTANPARLEQITSDVEHILKTELAVDESLTVLVTAQAMLEEQGVLGPVWFHQVEEGLALPDLLKPPLNQV